MTVRRCTAALLVLLAAPRAPASVADVFGLGSAYVGAGGAAVAEATDFAACHADPAGLAAGARPVVSFGYAVADSHIAAAGRRLGLVDAGGILLGIAVPLALHLSWLESVAFGLAVYAPPDDVVAIRAGPPDRPALPYYDRVARWLVLPALALRFPGGVALGAAVDLFAGLRGPVVITDGPTGAAEGRTALELYATATPIVGLRWDALPWLSFGLTYRAEFSAPAATIARADTGGAAVLLEASLAGLYRPHTLVAGVAARGEHWRAGLDISWEHWSAFHDALARVAAEWQGVGLDPPALDLPFRDSFGVRVGGEYRVPLRTLELALRAGYGFASRTLPADAPGAALLDGDKHVVSAGLGFRLPVEGRTLSLDVHVAAHLLTGASALVPAAEPSAPAGRVTASGVVLSTGLVLGVEW